MTARRADGSRHDVLELVVGPDHLPRHPKTRGIVLPRKNVYTDVRVVKDAKRGHIGVPYHTHEAQEFRALLHMLAVARGWSVGARVRSAVDRIKVDALPNAIPPTICAGLWHLYLHTVVTRRRSLDDGHVPYVDSDGCLSPVKDALMCAGILDDDGRIEQDHTSRAVSDVPGLTIRLVRVSDSSAQRMLPLGLDGDILTP